MGELDTKWELQLMLLGKPENMFRVSVGSFGDRELLWEHKPRTRVFQSHFPLTKLRIFQIKMFRLYVVNSCRYSQLVWPR